MTLAQFLVLLASGAGAAAVASFALERMDWFQSMTPEQKSNIVLAFSLAIALAAFAVIRYVPANVLQELAVWFQVVYSVIVVWLTTQIAHRIDPAV